MLIKYKIIFFFKSCLSYYMNPDFLQIYITDILITYKSFILRNKNMEFFYFLNRSYGRFVLVEPWPALPLVRSLDMNWPLNSSIYPFKCTFRYIYHVQGIAVKTKQLWSKRCLWIVYPKLKFWKYTYVMYICEYCVICFMLGKPQKSSFLVDSQL